MTIWFFNLTLQYWYPSVTSGAHVTGFKQQRHVGQLAFENYFLGFVGITASRIESAHRTIPIPPPAEAVICSLHDVTSAGEYVVYLKYQQKWKGSGARKRTKTPTTFFLSRYARIGTK
jgi:hypothetical protein